MKCDIIIPVWNQKDVTKDCIDSIVRNTKYPYRLILIDNASDNGTKSYLESLKSDKSIEITLIRNEENLGFVKAVNQGLKASTAPYICIMNNDTIATSGWLEKMIEFSGRNPDIGLINPQCDGPREIPLEEYAVILAKNGDKYMEMNQCFLFCTLMKREVLDKAGYLDEVFGMGCFDDTDYSMRVGLAGYRCASLHSAYVKHVHGVSFKALGGRKEIVEKCEREYYKKWPRHVRAGVSFYIDPKTIDKTIENMLKLTLFMARKWCWINLWIFGEKAENKNRVNSIIKKIGIPLHQNIKFNYIPKKFGYLQVLIRLVERSFGTKKRKKYDVVLADEKTPAYFLSFFYPIHKTKIIPVRADSDLIEKVSSIIDKIKKESRGG